MGSRERADTELVRRGFFPSREKAQAAIMAGQVFVGSRRIQKASEGILPEEEILLHRPENEYVSRGALKLEKAVRVFGADFRDKVILDIGASTGGFTDVSLRNGARRVYSVDVGYGQLDWKLRNDPRVTVMERTNARFLQPSDFPERPQITVMDVSFISIRLILPAAAGIMGEEGIFYTLVKPQFEAGREKVGKKGVVRDSAVHREVLENIVSFSESIGLRAVQLDYSPITGPEGNIEFLMEIRPRRDEMPMVTEQQIARVVEEAHLHMKRQA